MLFRPEVINEEEGWDAEDQSSVKGQSPRPMIRARILDEVIKVLDDISPDEAHDDGDDDGDFQIEHLLAWLFDDLSEINLKKHQRSDEGEDEHDGIGFDNAKEFWVHRDSLSSRGVDC